MKHVPIPKKILKECPLPHPYEWCVDYDMPGIFNRDKEDWWGWAQARDKNWLAMVGGYYAENDEHTFSTLTDALMYLWLQFIHGDGI